MLSESDESMSCGFSISVSSMSNKFSTGVSAKPYCGITGLFHGVEILGYVSCFL